MKAFPRNCRTSEGLMVQQLAGCVQKQGEGRDRHVICQLECCMQYSVCVCVCEMQNKGHSTALCQSCDLELLTKARVHACVITMLSEQMELRVPDIQSS